MTDEQLADSIATVVETALRDLLPKEVYRQLKAVGFVPPPAYLTAEPVDNGAGPVTKRAVLEAAIHTVADRGVPYGGVEDNFNRIALLWSAHMENRYPAGETGFMTPVFDAADVAMMMALLKIARLEAKPDHADSWIDVAGYAACGGEIGAKIAVDK